jgi:predicted nicotinamide N-methyase
MSSILNAMIRDIVPAATIQKTGFAELPEISLWLLQDSSCHLTTEEQRNAAAISPYWAFCWACGAVLARWILDHPQIVREKDVIDFGCGCGVVGIAAAIAGARSVTAVDSDPNAIVAVSENAMLNGVTIQPSPREPLPRADVLFAADILYERSNLTLLAEFPLMAEEIWLADSRIPVLPHAGYRLITRSGSATVPSLSESARVQQVRIYNCPEWVSG